MHFPLRFAAALLAACSIHGLRGTDAALTPPPQVPVPPIATGFAPLPGVALLATQATLPDPLAGAGGVAAWEARRPEVKRLLEYYATGAIPPAPGNVAGRELETRLLADGAVRFRLVRLSFGPAGKLGFDIAIFAPAKSAGPFPTVVWPSFDLTPGAAPLALQPRRPEQGKGLDSLTLPLGIPEPAADAKTPTAPDPEKVAEKHAELFRRGYALVTYHYQDTGEDTIARNADGSWAFRNTRFFPAYPRHDWGLLAAWAWGASRVVDFLESQEFADRARLIVTGHSRLGKSALVAGAFDERFALSAPIGSAGGGVGVYRACGFGRGGGEGLDDMMRKYPNWFSPHLHEFGADAEKLPFDQHWFVALTAPRAFFTADGITDRICTPDAVRRSLRAALPAYELHGQAARVGLYYGDHGHAFAPEDWTALLDFADTHLRGLPAVREFPPLPSAENLAVNVRELGAVGDGVAKDTAAFQRALDRCSAAGGGEVHVPAGDYLIAPIELRSRTTLVLEKDARLLGSPDIADYPLTRIRWEGRWEQGHRALITANDADGIAIVGPGHIAGAEALGRLRNPRAPALIEPIHCAAVRFEGFSTSYASMWSIHPTRCRDLVARGLTIRSTGGNGDGLDIDSCRNVLIERCDIDTGDDPIALKSGRGMEGFLAGEPTENVVIRQCTLGDRNYACIGVGSEMSGSVRNVTIEDCVFTHAKTNAIYLKGRPGRGGAIENVVARRLDIRHCEGAAIRVNLLKSGKDDPWPVPGFEGIPLGKNFEFTDLNVTGCASLVEAVLVSPEKPVEGFRLARVRGDCAKGLELANLRDVVLEDVAVTGFAGPLVTAENVTGTGLK